MLERTFHTPLPLDLEVGIPSGDIEIDTADGEESLVTVDGDERLLEEVEIHQDGNRVIVEYRGKGKIGLSIAPFSLVFGNSDLRVRAKIPHGSGVKIKTASADARLDGRFGPVTVNSVSGDVLADGEIGDAKIKTVSGDARLERVDGDVSAQTVSGDLRIGPATGSAEAKTVSGDIRFDALTAGDVRFTSISGDVEIGIAAGSALDVDAGSTSGDLSSEVPLGSEPLTGEDEVTPTVVLRGRTVSGDVKVIRAV